MTPDPNTATIRECIVEVAIIKHGSRTGYGEHMGQPTTDAAIAAMPKGIRYKLCSDGFTASWVECDRPDVCIAMNHDGLATTAWRLCLAMHIAEGRGK